MPTPAAARTQVREHGRLTHLTLCLAAALGVPAAWVKSASVSGVDEDTDDGENHNPDAPVIRETDEEVLWQPGNSSRLGG